MTASPRAAAGLLVLLVVLGAWAYLPWLGSPPLLDDPNDGQYAEVAREMVGSGEWLSPQLNYVLFLNKPPLLYWLTALSFEVFGVSEFAARLPGALSAIVLLLLTWRLGTALWGPAAGAWSAGVLLATGSMMVEARFVRPDLLLATAIVGALLAATRVAYGPSRRAPLLGLQVALAVAVLAKGVVGLLLPGAAVAVAVLATRRLRLVATFAAVRAWWLFVLLVAPWHAIATARHPGFFWDYVVNQHFLFFLDRKLPRDSEGIALGPFWLAFAMRLFPWTLFVPLALTRAWRGAEDEGGRWALGLLLGLVGGVLLLFSAAPSRLEHYSLPAVPACALLVGALLANADSYADPRRRAVLAGHVLPLACAGLAAPLALPRLVAAHGWLAGVRGLADVAVATGIVFALGTSAMFALLVAPRLSLRRCAGLALIAAMIGLAPMIQRGLALMTPLNSSAPLAAVINVVASESDTLVYEAPMEYQSGAGLCFYTRRRWRMLRPAGFVAPPYLVPHEDELFITRAELERQWEAGRVFFVSDPLAERSSMNGVVPDPAWIVARSGNRWLMSNERP